MKKTLIVSTLISFALIGCVGLEPGKKASSSTTVSEQKTNMAQTSLDYAGTYRTRLSCDDCEYINAQLQINPYGQYRYIEQKMKSDGPIGQPIVFQGKYTWDQQAPIIRLLNARNMHFFVAENQVVLLSTPVTSYSELTSEPRFQKVIR